MMDVELLRVEYQEEYHRIFATVAYGEEQPTGCWHRAQAEIFLDWTDSYEQLKQNALAAAKDFLTRAAAQDRYFIAAE
jgi:hypothetical protein